MRAMPISRLTEIPQMAVPQLESALSVDRVLVATDFSGASRAAFQTAMEVCGRFKAKMLLMHVFEYPQIAPPETGGMLLELQSCCERCQECLAGLAGEAKAAGLECETILESGVAATCILRAIVEQKADLVILGTRAPHGFERLVFGSTAEQVLRRSTQPVLTVGPRVAHTTGPVVFATDFNFTTMHAIRFAASFAKMWDVALHCLHVLPRALEGGQQADIVPGIVGEALAELAAESGVPLDMPTCATRFGSEVSHAVVEYAREQNAGLIVLGVRQASLLASHVPEHITYRIITEASCPVMTMAYGAPASKNVASGPERSAAKLPM